MATDFSLICCDDDDEVMIYSEQKEQMNKRSFSATRTPPNPHSKKHNLLLNHHHAKIINYSDVWNVQYFSFSFSFLIFIIPKNFGAFFFSFFSLLLSLLSFFHTKLKSLFHSLCQKSINITRASSSIPLIPSLANPFFVLFIPFFPESSARFCMGPIASTGNTSSHSNEWVLLLISPFFKVLSLLTVVVCCGGGKIQKDSQTAA